MLEDGSGWHPQIMDIVASSSGDDEGQEESGTALVIEVTRICMW